MNMISSFPKKKEALKWELSLLQKSEHQKPSKNKKNITFFVKHHYIKSVFLVHHYYDKDQTFDVLILPIASKKITTLKIKISTTYGVLPMVTKACGGLGQGQLG